MAEKAALDASLRPKHSTVDLSAGQGRNEIINRRIGLNPDFTNKWQVTIFLIKVEAIADNKAVFDFKAQKFYI
ncbi:hypothetical protein GCM10007354_35760 [Acinetobacter courvalinii]|uniref:Uncharacterized protein n=1 Tax=Acinetobacter courvalinii TaxID=280147 RepID=A0ABD0ACZ7_9GAMM|nr:hypothetical protein GCM10007354_35760 [Acinetobacter courvalinii]